MNNRVALPVTGDNNILLGITIDDVLWVAEEEFSEDIQKIGGTQALDEPTWRCRLLAVQSNASGWFRGTVPKRNAHRHRDGFILRARSRNLWCWPLFIPLIISSGGNTGSQASTLIIQAMAVGEITVASWWRVIRQEIDSGVMLGSVLGIIRFHPGDCLGPDCSGSEHGAGGIYRWLRPPGRGALGYPQRSMPMVLKKPGPTRRYPPLLCCHWWLT